MFFLHASSEGLASVGKNLADESVCVTEWSRAEGDFEIKVRDEEAEGGGVIRPMQAYPVRCMPFLLLGTRNVFLVIHSLCTLHWRVAAELQRTMHSLCRDAAATWDLTCSLIQTPPVDRTNHNTTHAVKPSKIPRSSVEVP